MKEHPKRALTFGRLFEQRHDGKRRLRNSYGELIRDKEALRARSERRTTEEKKRRTVG